MWIVIAAYVLFALGGLLCLHNFYLSFLRYGVYKLLGNESNYRWVSGIPVFGSMFVVVALLVLREPVWLIVLGAAIAALDTAGLHWFVGTMCAARIFNRGRRPGEAEKD